MLAVINRTRNNYEIRLIFDICILSGPATTETDAWFSAILQHFIRPDSTSVLQTIVCRTANQNSSPSINCCKQNTFFAWYVHYYTVLFKWLDCMWNRCMMGKPAIICLKYFNCIVWFKLALYMQWTSARGDYVPISKPTLNHTFSNAICLDLACYKHYMS